MTNPQIRNTAYVQESGNGPYGQFITIGNHVLAADEPLSLGGKNTGPDPIELMLAALGACTVMTLRMYANRKQLPLEDVRIAVTNTRIKPVNAGDKPMAIERVLTLVGHLDAEQRQRLVEIADKCPVGMMLDAAVEITTVLKD